jgi:hypothetical protein
VRLIDYVCMSALAMALIACSSFALNDPHFILDPPAHNLRGKAPKDDRPESDCDPVKKPDGSIEYKCVVHTFPAYGALLEKIDRLETELKACQQSKN